MVETVWVLGRAYGFVDQEIAAAVELLLQTDVLVIENEQEVFTAMIALNLGRGDFADALIGTLDAKAGCKYTLTFDQKALRLSGFRARLGWQQGLPYFTSANSRVGPPEPSSSLIGATTIVAPAGGTNPRFATFSN